MLKRYLRMLTTIAIFVPGSASAQSLDLDQVDRMQRQMEQLQKQMKQMKQVKSELVEAKKSAADRADPGRPAVYPTKAPNIIDRVNLTWGGFLAAETVYRPHNTVSDIGTPFNGIPYPFSPQYGEGEFHGTARQSRLSILAEGALDPVQQVSGYYEMDFLSVGVTSNYNQSNSWAPRLRQGFFAYDNTEWGFHFLGGQAWSLLTQNTVGIAPRRENIPLTIDANYVVGFDYTRNWQLRVVKDFGPWASLGVSVENPAEEVYSSTGSVANGGNVGGSIVNFQNSGSSFLGSSGFANNFTTDIAPDIIAKAAFDPGWGHYEVFGLQRFFSGNTFGCRVAPINVKAPTPPATTPAAETAGTCSLPLSSTFVGSQSEKIKSGDGVGGSVLLPVIAKFLDVTASALYGRGIGRYGAGQLSDVVVGPDGSLSPIKAVHALGGVIAHPWAGLDVYGYAGMEKAQASYNSIVSTGSIGGLTGFGVPTAVNSGCYITTPASFTGGASNCAAINRTLSDVTVGFWQDFYKGNYGRVAGGFEWEIIRRQSFAGVSGVGGAPIVSSVSTSDNVFMTSLRYYPF
jgi:hypothetical protein